MKQAAQDSYSLDIERVGAIGIKPRSEPPRPHISARDIGSRPIRTRLEDRSDVLCAAACPVGCGFAGSLNARSRWVEQAWCCTVLRCFLAWALRSVPGQGVPHTNRGYFRAAGISELRIAIVPYSTPSEEAVGWKRSSECGLRELEAARRWAAVEAWSRLPP